MNDWPTKRASVDGRTLTSDQMRFFREMFSPAADPGGTNVVREIVTPFGCALLYARTPDELRGLLDSWERVK